MQVDRTGVDHLFGAARARRAGGRPGSAGGSGPSLLSRSLLVVPLFTLDATFHDSSATFEHRPPFKCFARALQTRFVAVVAVAVAVEVGVEVAVAVEVGVEVEVEVAVVAYFAKVCHFVCLAAAAAAAAVIMVLMVAGGSRWRASLSSTRRLWRPKPGATWAFVVLGRAVSLGRFSVLTLPLLAVCLAWPPSSSSAGRCATPNTNCASIGSLRSREASR